MLKCEHSDTIDSSPTRAMPQQTMMAVSVLTSIRAYSRWAFGDDEKPESTGKEAGWGIAETIKTKKTPRASNPSYLLNTLFFNVLS